MDSIAVAIVKEYILKHLDKTDKKEWYLDAYKKFENMVVKEA